jgi:hypothetical protein
VKIVLATLISILSTFSAFAQSQTNFDCVVSGGGAYYGPFNNEAQAVESITNQAVNLQGMQRGSFTVTCWNMGPAQPQVPMNYGFFGADNVQKNSNQQISK